MAFVQASKISLAFGDRDILDDVTIVLQNGTKAALAGANGSGKSTLMKVLSGEIKADDGEISKEKGTRVAYLPQSGIVFKESTLYEEAEKAFSHFSFIIEEIENILSLMSIERDEKKLISLSQQLHTLQSQLDASSWNMREALIVEILQGLGFLKNDLSRKTHEFSGGWQMRIALAKILLSEADIIILDEPTNYLDIEAREFLKGFLLKFKGGFLLVSHDRDFLDSVAKETYEIFKGKLKKYVGTYTAYEKQREEEIAFLLKKWEEQQEEIAKTEEFIRRFRSNARRAGLVQDRIKRLEKMELVEIPEHLKKIHFNFPDAPHSGKIVLNLKNITKSYASHCVIKDFSFLIERSSKLCFVGRNGAGKSTLLRVIAGVDANFEGDRCVGEGVQIGYFSQEASEEIQGNITILDYIENKAPTHLIPKIKSMLAAFLFRGDDIYKNISVLSGGEKSRLALLSLLLRPLNLLILDEPTNHLDIHSKDVLLQALQKFDGTVLFVSHDKYFIEHLATGIVELRHKGDAFNPSSTQPSQVRYFPGTYDYYLYRCKKEKEGELVADSFFEKQAENSTAENQKNIKPNILANDEASTTIPLSYEERKKQKTANAKKKREEETLMKQIEEIELKIQKKNEELGRPEIYKDGTKSKKMKEEIALLEAQVEELTNKWEALIP